MKNNIEILTTSQMAQIFWKKPDHISGETCYQIYLDGQLAGVTTKTHYQIPGLKQQTSYQAEIRCQTSLGERQSDDQADSQADERTETLGTVSFETGREKIILDISKAPYHAVGDGKTMNTTIIQRAIDDCGEYEAVYIPAGIFLTGALRLHSHMELYLEKGAVLQGSDDPQDYLPKIHSRFEGTEMECYSSLLNLGELDASKGCTSTNVVIRGEGTISGGGRVLAERVMGLERERLKDYIASLGDKVLECENENTIPGRARGRLINLSNAEHVWISGLTLQNGPSWNVHMIYCKDIVTDHCTFRSEQIWNGDGWDPDSSAHCTIFACTFYTGDDSVAIKSGKNPEGNRIARPCEDISVFDCCCAYGHGIAVGSEMSGGIQRVSVWDCDLGNSMYGIEIKGTKKRGGYVRDISVRDCRVPRIMMHSVGYNDDGEGAEHPPVFEDCSFERLKILGEYLDKEHQYQPCTAIELKGFDESGYEVKRVHFRNICLGDQTARGCKQIVLEKCSHITLEEIQVR